MPLWSLLLPAMIACYTLAFVVELRRQLAPGRLPARWTLGFLTLGWLLHTTFLVVELLQRLPTGTLVAGWHQWWLVLAWAMALASGGWIASRPRTAVGLFVLLPLLLLVLVAWQLPRDVSFPVVETNRQWIMLHGICLLLGTAAVLVGTVAGAMYLVQSARLRSKRPMWGFRLPSLESLQRINELSFLVSSLLVIAGLLIGVMSNLHLQRDDRPSGLPWTDPVVWTSGLLAAWLVAADIFSVVYKPARQGRKVAYLLVASFVFLGLVLGMVLLSETAHTRRPAAQLPPANRVATRVSMARPTRTCSGPSVRSAAYCATMLQARSRCEVMS